MKTSMTRTGSSLGTQVLQVVREENRLRPGFTLDETLHRALPNESR